MSDHDVLIDLIVDVVGVERSRITDEASLFHDLGMAGLDGAELLEEIGARFDIDLSRVDWVRYFGAERRYNPFHHLWCMLGGRRLDEGIVPLRVSDLKRSVTERRWCEPSREETG